MGKVILNHEELRIASDENFLAWKESAARLKAVKMTLDKAEELLVNAGTPGGDILQSIEMLVCERDHVKTLLEGLLLAIAGDSSDLIIADYRVPDITAVDVSHALQPKNHNTSSDGKN